MAAPRDTYVNFSTPHRSQSVKSMFSRKRWSFQKRGPHDEESEAGTEISGPVKAQFSQSYHVTADDLDLSSKRPISELRHPVIPERTTSLAGNRHRLTGSWPVYSRRAGSIKFETVPTLTRTPWEAARSERPGSSRWSRASDRTRTPSRRFAQLPQEIFQCVVDHIELVRSSSDGIDVPGIRRDLRMLCLVNKQWQRVARERLYQDLWLPNNKTPAKRKWSRQQARSRLRMLHDTLRDHPGLAFLVQRIRFTAEIAEEVLTQAYLPSRKESALELLQDIVHRCYNVERLCGFVVPLTSATFPLFDALSTRSRLKEIAWNLESARAELPGLAEFIYCHDQWVNLERLVLAADPGVDLGQVAISAMLMRLPALKHLMVSGLDASDFSNATLPILPALKSLRLENLAGVTDRGVEQLAFSRVAPSLGQLRLVGLELVSLQTVSTLLSHLTRLKRFAIVQDTSPEAQTGVKFVGRNGTFGSSSLQRLHWDCLIPGSALKLFAEGIEMGRFPNLQQVCTPCDYDGIIQALCRPIPRSKLIQDDLEYLEIHSQKYERDLRAAQIQAQLRVRASRQQPYCNVIVQDETNEVHTTHMIGSFLGDMSSKIEYCLEPEAGANAMACLDDVAWPSRYDASGVEQQQDLSKLF